MSASEDSDSAPMSQSDSEGEVDLPEEEKPMFPYERLYHSAEDKADIETKPEIEREAILADRNEKLERYEQNLALRRLMQSRAKDHKDPAKKKRKASAADLDEGQRKSSRQRTKASGTSNALAAYKKQRENKALLEERRKSGKPEPRRDPSREDYSDADADGESDNDYEYDDRKRRKETPPPPKDDPQAELSDLQRVRIGRENFAQVCYNPGFEEIITNCYARVCLGPGRIPGQNEYRLCSIKGFSEGRPYAIEGPNRKSVLVNKYILAAHGKATRTWSFLECSNSKFTDDEWRRYRLTMANEDCRMPTRGQINTKLDQINKLITHRFTDAQISNKLKQQSAVSDMVSRTTEKNEIKDQIRDAEDRGDDDAVRELEEKLMNIVPMKLAFGTSMHPANTQKQNNDIDRVAELNRRNQRQTTENIQKAAMLKRRTYKKAPAEPDKLSVPSAKPKHLDDDLFGSGSDISRAATPVNGVSRAGTPAMSNLGTGANISRSGTPLSMRTGTETKKGLPVIKKSKRDDEILQSMDLGIDIEI